MRHNSVFQFFLLASLATGFIFHPDILQAAPFALISRPAAEVTAFDLIIAMNSIRASNGLPPLIEDPIIDAVAQSTAQTMANNQMSWHIGDVSGRLSAAGYGDGAKVWATENFDVGLNQSIDEIMVVWSDASHMLPAVVPAYCNVGAGTARAPNGMTYYILQAAYTSGKSCGEYTSSGTTTSQTGGTIQIANPGVPQLILPVKIATPDSDGKIFHLVQSGQTFWSIAIAYKITIKDLKSWNNLSQDDVLNIGQKLFIPGTNTAGYATPTQSGAIQVSTPDTEGQVLHIVQSYQTLTTISQAYGITVEKILALNAIQADWPLRIGQKLIIHSSNSTPSPTLQPIQLLTPASDGKFYHTVQSGETLSWIAQRFKISINDLMTWNSLNSSSVIQPNQRLLLLITPPASSTSEPVQPTETSLISTVTPFSLTATPIASAQSPETTPPTSNNSTLWGGVILIMVGLFVGIFYFRSKK